MSAVTAPRRSPVRDLPPSRRERRHLRVVEEVPKRHPVAFLLLYLATGVGVVLGAVSLNALAAGDAVTARELESQVDVEARQHELLIAEVASLEDPERIRTIAEGLGMVPAAEPRFLEPGRGLPSDRVPPATGDPVKPLLTAGRG